MEQENKKRAREDEEKNMRSESRKKQEVMSPEGREGETIELSDSANSAEVGLFEFPWEKENLVLDGWKSGDEAFYSSLLDVAADELPNEGLRHWLSPPSPVVFPEEKVDGEWWPEEEETEGVDCIWSSVLSQPISTIATKASTTTI